jgi:hypothetical protein
MKVSDLASALGVTPKTIYRYRDLGAPLDSLEALEEWVLEQGLRPGVKGRSPFRAVIPRAAAEARPGVVPPPASPPIHVPDPTAASATPTPAEVQDEEVSVHREVMASPNPIVEATLLHRIEQAAYKRAQRKILEGAWLQKEAVERVQTEQAVAVRERLLALAERLAPRVVGREEPEIRAIMNSEVEAILVEWSEKGEI